MASSSGSAKRPPGTGERRWGLAGVWTGLTLFITLRLVAVLVRVAGERWLAAPDTVTA